MKEQLRKFYKEQKSTILILLTIFVVRGSFVEQYHIPSGSMLPTLQVGEMVVLDRTAYDIRIPFTSISLMKREEPKAGDVVMFTLPSANIIDQTYIKRILGVPGDKIEVIEDFTYINGKKTSYEVVDEDELAIYYRQEINGKENTIRQLKTGPSRLQRVKPMIVPEGHYFMVGDNRRNSGDSRRFGFVPYEDIKGRATRILGKFDSFVFFDLLPASLPDMERFWEAI